MATGGKQQEEIEQSENRAQEEMRAPLITQTNTTVTEEKQDRCMVYLSTFVAACGSFTFGSCVGYSSPTQSAIRENLNLSIAEYSLFGSIMTFGAMIGAITSGPIADYLGRKGAMRISSAFCIAGWLDIYYAQGALSLDIGRLATGYGMGVFSYVLMISTGIAVSFIIGTMLTWRALALTGLVPCVILLFGLFIIPESPRWLAKIGHQKEFEIALRRLRGKSADISEEAEEIQDYIRTLEKLPKANLFDLFQRRYLRSVIAGVGLMVFHQFGGLSGITFYTRSIFESSGRKLFARKLFVLSCISFPGFPSEIGTIIFAIVKVFITALGAALIDRAGRKPLLLVSATGLVIGCILTGISFYLKGHEIAIKAAPILSVIGIVVYVGSFSVGMGPVPWVVMSEIISCKY